ALRHRGLEFFRVDSRHELVALDLGIEVREELLDLARHLGADLHGDHRVEGARGRAGGGERTALNLRRAEFGSIAPALRVEPGPARRGGQYERQGHDPETPSHGLETTLWGLLFLATTQEAIELYRGYPVG